MLGFPKQDTPRTKHSWVRGRLRKQRRLVLLLLGLIDRLSEVLAIDGTDIFDTYGWIIRHAEVGTIRVSIGQNLLGIGHHSIICLLLGLSLLCTVNELLADNLLLKLGTLFTPCMLGGLVARLGQLKHLLTGQLPQLDDPAILTWVVVLGPLVVNYVLTIFPGPTQMVHLGLAWPDAILLLLSIILTVKEILVCLLKGRFIGLVHFYRIVVALRNFLRDILLFYIDLLLLQSLSPPLIVEIELLKGLLRVCCLFGGIGIPWWPCPFLHILVARDELQPLVLLLLPRAGRAPSLVPVVGSGSRLEVPWVWRHHVVMTLSRDLYFLVQLLPLPTRLTH